MIDDDMGMEESDQSVRDRSNVELQGLVDGEGRVGLPHVHAVDDISVGRTVIFGILRSSKFGGE